MLTHAQVPANDGGLALGQAAVAAARLIDRRARLDRKETRHVPRHTRPHRPHRRRRADLATVDVCGVRRQINIACIVDDDQPVEACVGDWVLVHVGFAMSRIDEAQAARTLQILAELGEAQAEIDAHAAVAANRRPDDVRRRPT